MRYLIAVIISFTFLSVSSQTLEQEVRDELSSSTSLNTSGGEAAGFGGSASFSIGQVVYSTNFTSDYTVSEGVQQPVLTEYFPEKPAEEKLPITFQAYPNPMTDYLILEVKNLEDRKLDYELLDLHGRLLHRNPLQGSKTKITPRNLQSAVYLLRISENGKPIRTFKILKD